VRRCRRRPHLVEAPRRFALELAAVDLVGAAVLEQTADRGRLASLPGVERGERVLLPALQVAQQVLE
jgi:hypothetical protein